MTEPSTSPTPPAETPGGSVDSAKLVYILYFIGYVIGITWIAGVIVAYLKRPDADAVTATHFTYQIRTFWIGLLYIAIGTALMVLMVGFLVWLFAVVWSLVRSIKGFILIGEGKPVPDPETWLW